MLRALAAFSVVIHHGLETSGGAARKTCPDWITMAGASGVDIFFVISGFIMLHVSFGPGRSPPTPVQFLARRLTRIYPFYWICCLAILAMSSLGFLSSHHYRLPMIASSLGLVPGEQLIGVAWTLVYEIYFYILFACTLWLRSASVSLLGTSGAIVLIYGGSMLVPPNMRSDFLANPLPIEFCLGLGLAYFHTRTVRAGRRWPVGWSMTFVGLFLLMVAAMVGAHADTAGLLPLPRVLLWGVPAMFVVAGVLHAGPPRNAVSRIAILLGDASYAVYLTHVFVMIGYGRLLKISAVNQLPQMPWVVAATLLSAAVGVAAHLWIEKPLLAMIRDLIRRRSFHAVPAVI